MKITIEFKEIEHLIFTKYGLRTEMECTDNDNVVCHVRYVGLTCNLLLSIDRTYDVVNSLKLRISGNMLSNFVIPKVLKYLCSKFNDAVIAKSDGSIIVNLAKFAQLKSFLELYTLKYVSFSKSAVNAEFQFI